MIGPEELALLQPEAFFIVISRGGIIHEPTLIRMLEEGKLAGAALDVAATEPLPKGRSAVGRAEPVDHAAQFPLIGADLGQCRAHCERQSAALSEWRTVTEYGRYQTRLLMYVYMENELSPSCFLPKKRARVLLSQGGPSAKQPGTRMNPHIRRP